MSRISRDLTQFCLLTLSIAIIIIPSKIVGAQALRPQNQTCPTDIKILTEQLLKDLPSYSNRVIQRARRRKFSDPIQLYVIIAGKPEFEPLPISLVPSQYPTNFPNLTEQVFFTTLERQYNNDRVVQLQNYYWLFLTLTEEGWKLVAIYTQLASLKPGDIPLPPRDNRNGIVGQAVHLWLRDCQAGTLR